MAGLVCRRVVIPVDFSEESVNAIRQGLEIAERPQDVHLLHVLLPLDAVSPGVIWGEVSDASRETAVREHFAKFLADHEFPSGDDGPTIAIRFGNPGLQVAHYADEVDAELVVISSHGYHGVKRFLLGSVAERVIRHVHCPVLVLRRTDAE